MAGNRRKLQEGFRAQESRTIANFHKNVVVQRCFGRNARLRSSVHIAKAKTLELRCWAKQRLWS